MASGGNTLPIGFRLDEYQIQSVLGAGGFGITYLAHDTKLGAQVAIKEYFPQAYAARTAQATIVPHAVPGAQENYRWGLQEFLKEARALARFKHVNIVRVLRFLETHGTAYLVMEYEEGEPLTNVLRRHGGFLDEPTLLSVFLPILSGLQAVHEAGLLHLDIKPDNIYLRHGGQPMLIDFGSSRQIRRDVAEASQKIALTPGYCAPEQYPGHGETGAWSDVYSMGTTLYRCITGKEPVDAMERLRGIDQKHHDPMPAASSFSRPFYAPAIRASVDAALSLATEARPQSAYALQQGLMGRGLDKAAPGARTVNRLGSGYLGQLGAAKEEDRRRRYSGIEKLVFTLVFLASLAISIPTVMLSLGQLSEETFYDWLDVVNEATVSRAVAAGDYINEKVFGKRATPKATGTPGLYRRNTEAELPAKAPEGPPPPFGHNKRLAQTMTLPEPAFHGFVTLKFGTTLATAADDGSVRLWDIGATAPRAVLPVSARTPSALAAFSGGRQFAAPDRDNTIVIWDALGQKQFTLPAIHLAEIRAICISASGKYLASAGIDGLIVIWDLTQNVPLHQLPHRERDVQALAFSPDEKSLHAAGEHGTVMQWEIASGKPLGQWKSDNQPVTAISLSADGKWLATLHRDGKLLLWPAAGGQPPRPLGNTVRGAQFSPDGQWLVVATADGAIRSLNPETAEAGHEIQPAGAPMTGFVMSGDGRFLAAANGERQIRLWQ